MKHIMTVGLMIAALTQAGCAAMWAGAGAAGAAGAYEAKNKHDLDKLEEQRARGDVSPQDYGTRKDAIEDRSLVY
jgi:hypothetical protein